MEQTLPGTTLPYASWEGDAFALLEPMLLAAGGLSLSQICALTGLEGSTVQNWVKRGFLPPPEHKMYNRNQFCRIVTINMLRESMQIDTITKLLSYINGHLDDASDDIVNDSDLYNYYINLLAVLDGHQPDRDEIRTHILYITSDFKEPRPGGKKRLALVLEVMLYAYYSAQMRRQAEELLQHLD